MHLQEKAADAQEADDAPPAPPPRPRDNFGDEDKKTAAVRAPRKLPYRAPDYLLIFDDLADQLKAKSVATMLKKNRHFHFKSVVSSHWINDLLPDALRMMDVVCLYRGHSTEKLTELYKKARLGVSLEEFMEMYADATSVPFGFLYIDMNEGTFRKSFADEYVLSE